MHSVCVLHGVVNGAAHALMVCGEAPLSPGHEQARARRKRRKKLAVWVVGRWRGRVEHRQLQPAAAFASAFLRAKALLAWSITARHRAVLRRLLCFAQVRRRCRGPPHAPYTSHAPVGMCMEGGEGWVYDTVIQRGGWASSY